MPVMVLSACGRPCMLLQLQSPTRHVKPWQEVQTLEWQAPATHQHALEAAATKPMWSP